MVSTYAVIQNGTVTNVVAWDGENDWTPPADAELVEIDQLPGQPGIGWTYDGTNFIAPPDPPVEQEQTL